MTDTTQLSTKQSTTPAPTGAATTQPGAPIGRQSVQAAEQATRAATDTLRLTADTTAAAAQRAGEVAVETVQRADAAGSETMRKGMEGFVDHQRELVETATNQFEAISRMVAQTAQGITEDLRAFMTRPPTANTGLQDLRQSMTGIIEGVVRTNVRATQELLQVTTPSGFVELQQRYMREYLDVLMHGTMTFCRATRRTADETLRPVEQQLEQRRQFNQRAQAQQAAE